DMFSQTSLRPKRTRTAASIEPLESRRMLAQAVASFTLVNASNGAGLTGFDPIQNGATIDLAQLSTQSFSIRANTNPATVGSVQFGLDAQANIRIENAAPYAMLGNNGSVYTPWNASLGSHTVTATPFSGSNLSGTVG